jgi:hypothetical protein
VELLKGTTVEDRVAVVLGGDPSHTLADLQIGRLPADLLVAGTVLKPLGPRGAKSPETKLTVSLTGGGGAVGKIYDSETAKLKPVCPPQTMKCVSQTGVYLLDQIKLPTMHNRKATEVAAEVELWEKSATAGAKWVAVDTAPIQLPVPAPGGGTIDQPLTPAPDLQAVNPVPLS